MLDFNFVGNLAQRDTDINEHLLDLYGIVVSLETPVVVELGAGQSTFALAAATKNNGTLYSIDTCEDAHLRGYEEGRGILEREKHCHIWNGDSLEIDHWMSKIKKKIHFLFIDTSHEYSQTIQELKRWSPHLIHNGIIALHDTGHKDESKHGYGVRKALDEFVEASNHPSYYPIHLQDTKHIGMSIVLRLDI